MEIKKLEIEYIESMKDYLATLVAQPTFVTRVEEAQTVDEELLKKRTLI